MSYIDEYRQAADLRGAQSTGTNITPPLPEVIGRDCCGPKTVSDGDLLRGAEELVRQAREVRVTDPTTGGQKGAKPEAYALIPVEALADIARVYGYGAEKYAPNNWRKGYAWSLSYSALQRHLNAFWSGEENDPESGLPHLAHAAFHILTLLTYSRPPRSGSPYETLDDRNRV